MSSSPWFLSSRVATLAALLAAGCIAETGAPEDDIQAETGAIQGGQLESGYPTVGQIQNSTGGTCTGTLIHPSFVLTAKHIGHLTHTGFTPI
jgi:V8-like Glu-specific endopeptidase